MEYIYSVEKYLSRDYFSYIHATNSITFQIVCYNICYEGRYPFLQFLLEKPLSGLLKLPEITIANDNVLEETVTDYIYRILKYMKISPLDLDIDNIQIKGIYKDKHIIFVDISNLDICKLELGRESRFWFGLYTEIVSICSIYDLLIDPSTTQLFIENYIFGIIMYKTDYGNLKEIVCPDVGYTSDVYSRSRIHNVFGYSKCDTKYGYVMSFHLLFNNTMGPSINRYALFMDTIFIQEDTNNIENSLQLYDTVIVDNNIAILKEYNQQIPLSLLLN
jgi:hypothetical protein